MKLNRDTLNNLTGTLAGAVGGVTVYFAALGISGWTGVASAPLVGGVCGALGVYAVYARRAAKRYRSHALWTETQQINALHDHTFVVLTDESGLICDVNDTLLSATGWNRDDLIGAPESILMAANDQTLYTKLRIAMQEGESWKGHNRLNKKDGGSLHTHTTMMPRLDEKGRMNGSISVRTETLSNDILDSDRNLVSVLNRLRDEIYIFDAETLRFCYLNESALKSVGWSQEKIGQKSINDLTPGFDTEKFRILAKPLIENKVKKIGHSIRFRGRTYDAELQLIRNDEGVDQFVCVMRDATERVETERLRSEFVATVSHELRSPMTSIKGAIGLVLSGTAGELSDKTRSLLDIAHRNANRLVLIINDILDLEKLDADAMVFENQDNDMSALIREAVEAICPFSNRFDVEVHTQGLETPVMANFDSNRMMQVLVNLMSNAIKFSPAGESVTVELITNADSLRVEVRDNGKGVPADKQAHLFDRFSKISSEDATKVRSTGLGLSIVKTIVEKQGGRVGVSSFESQGSTFYFELPINLSEGGVAEKSVANR